MAGAATEELRGLSDAHAGDGSGDDEALELTGVQLVRRPSKLAVSS